MVVDKIENLKNYVSLNPLFAQVVEYFNSTDLMAQEIGKVKLQGDELVVNFQQAKAKTKEDALLTNVNKWLIAHPESGLGDQEFIKALDENRIPELKAIRIQMIGPVIGAHCGPGTLAACFMGKERSI